MPSVFHEYPQRSLLRSPMFWAVVISGVLSIWALLCLCQPPVQTYEQWDQFQPQRADR